MLRSLKDRAEALQSEAVAVYIAFRDPRVPWYAKLLGAFVVAHTFSPIDLIPDFIPVVGYLDDIIITPLGIALFLRMVPPEVMAEARAQVPQWLHRSKPVVQAGIVIVLLFWAVTIALIAIAAVHLLAD